MYTYTSYSDIDTQSLPSYSNLATFFNPFFLELYIECFGSSIVDESFTPPYKYSLLSSTIKYSICSVAGIVKCHKDGVIACMRVECWNNDWMHSDNPH